MRAITVSCWRTAVFNFLESPRYNHLCLTVIGLLEQNVTSARLPFYIKIIDFFTCTLHADSGHFLFLSHTKSG